MTADESAPLLPPADRSLNGNGRANAAAGQDHDRREKTILSRLLRAVSVENRILFAGFLITLSFSFTQVP